MDQFNEYNQLVNLQDDAYKCLKRFRIEYLMDSQNRNSKLLIRIDRKLRNRFERRAKKCNNFWK